MDELLTPHSGRFIPGYDIRYVPYGMLEGLQGRSGGVRKISLQQEFYPRTFHLQKKLYKVAHASVTERRWQ
jgi:hypothetical protein